MGRLEKIEKFEKSYGWISVENAKYLLLEVKRLREAIEKHKWENWGVGEDSKGKMYNEPDNYEDDELYKALEEK